MSGPWEKYADPNAERGGSTNANPVRIEISAADADEGPWSKYAPAPKALPKALTSLGGDIDTQIGTITAEGYKSNPEQVEQDIRTAAPRFYEGAVGGAKIMGQRMTPDDTNWDPNPLVVGGQKLDLVDRAPREQLNQEVEDYKKRRPDLGTPGFAGELFSEGAISGGPLAKTATGISTLLPKALGAFRPAAAAVGTNAAYEGGKVAAEGGDWKDIGLAAGLGGFGAGVGHGFGGVAQRGVQPVMSDAAKGLMEKGVMPTYGAMMGRGVSKAEEGLTYSPVIGGAVQRARDRMAEGFNRASLNEGLEPIGKTVTEVGDRGAAQGKAFIKGAYEEVVPHLEVPAFGKHFAVNDAVADINSNILGLHPENIRQLTTLKNDILRKGGSAWRALDGKQWKELDSELGRVIRANTGPAADAQSKQYAEAVRIFKDRLRDRVAPTQGAPLDAMDKLKAADAAYRNYVPIHKATSKAMGSEGTVGGFNPLQMFRSGEQTRVGTGDLTRHGLEVISTPPSKNMGILRKALQIPGSLGALYLDPATAALWAGANLAYSRPVQGLVAKGVPGVNAAFENLPFTAAQLGSQVGGRALPKAYQRHKGN